MRKTNLIGVKLIGASLTRTNLSGVDFSMEQLQGVNFRHTTLHGSDLSLAELHEADFFNANTTLMAVKATDLSTCKNLTQQQLNLMFGDASTILPDHLDRPNCSASWFADDLTFGQFNKKWQAAKDAANL